MEENTSADKNYISLLEASKLCSYSEPYLRLRARQGKLKSIKLGKKWMTTAAWIDDYAARVQQWQEMAAARKEVLPEARLVAAPSMLENNLADEVTPSNFDTSCSEKQEVFPDTAQMRPMAVLASEGQPMLPPPAPKRLKAFPPAAQLYPVPQETKFDDVASFGWFGALLSGAVCALVLFLSFGYGNIDFNNFGSAKSGQANLGQAFDRFENIIILQAEKTDPQAAWSQSSEPDPLKRLVEQLARFLNRR